MPTVKVKSIPTQGLSVEDNQYTPISQNTIMLNGLPHSQGGVDISYGGNQVEAENGETLSKNSNGDMVIFGNMNIPGSKTKFKNAVKQIGEEEAKAEKLSTKANTLVATNDPYNKYESTAFQSGLVLEDAANIKRNQAQNQKESLGILQDMMLKTAEMMNIDPSNLERAMNGKKVPQLKCGGKMKAKDGLTLAERNNNPGNIKYFGQEGATKGDKGFAKFNSYEDGFNALKKDIQAKQSGKTRTGLNGMSSLQDFINVYAPAGDNNNPEQYTNTVAQWTGTTPSTPIGAIPTERLAQAIARFEDGAYADKMGNNQDLQTPNNQPNNTNSYVPPTSPLSRNYQYIAPLSTGYGQPQINIQADYYNPETGSYQATPPAYMTNTQNTVSPSAPVTTPSATRSNLSPLDFLGEAAAIFDRPDYVQLQQYNPQLLQPYSVSFQDQINQNQSTFNSLVQQLGSTNPAALSTLAAQKYAADQQVLGNQFRTNQGIANEVTNQNTQILNDAQLKNIQLADTQFVRQEQARANTDAARQAALNSISNKIQANRAVNRGIDMYNQQNRIAESFSDFRRDANGNLIYTGTNPSVDYLVPTPQPYTPYDASQQTEITKNNIEQSKLQREQLKTQQQQIRNNNFFSNIFGRR